MNGLRNVFGTPRSLHTLKARPFLVTVENLEERDNVVVAIDRAKPVRYEQHRNEKAPVSAGANPPRGLSGKPAR